MTTPYTPTPFKAPTEHPDNGEFWAAAREGRLLVRHCDSCGKPHWYPRTLCPFCLGTTHWKQASGRGTIYSYSVTRRAGPTPFCMAYVTLEEGVTMMTQIVDCDLDSVRIGQKVQLRFSPSDGGAPLPTFTLA
ncbi:OB-fold domain-containing protein [Cupriavidus metallidurans]|uniref:Zn-ribbon domain-containing OB-fold protein n=1 Tax=Cupriavidus TaxID=106589 RepID=UPI000E86999E|nr:MULTISPECIES: OB-fold domain-containing protein [unclassified Cupriavidus]GMG94368.1 DNA-binding protein [Cupriavidus sp. TKC]HBD33541.1 DNA-binding protein [Cupriavidus sp.]HBO81990.1 DNA-binding protein [Cupriavidus sp.]